MTSNQINAVVNGILKDYFVEYNKNPDEFVKNNRELISMMSISARRTAKIYTDRIQKLLCGITDETDEQSGECR